MKYRTFVRTWWRKNPKWPNGLEPGPGRKRHNRYHSTEAEARDACEAYNSTHNPGKLSRKMEFESC